MQRQPFVAICHFLDNLYIKQLVIALRTSHDTHTVVEILTNGSASTPPTCRSNLQYAGHFDACDFRESGQTELLGMLYVVFAAFIGQSPLNFRIMVA